jgi:L-fucose isomerase-like protein
MTINLGLVPIVRPLFRGARMGLLERSERALAALGPRLGFQVAYAAPPVTTPDEAEVAAAEAGERARAGSLDFLLVLHVTFATGDLIAPILEQSLPAGIWALPEATASGPLPQNALCGLNLSLSLPASRAMPVKWFYGWAEDAAFESRLALTVRALCGWKAVRRGRVLWVGGTAPGFYRLESVPDLPVEIERVALDALFAALDEVRDDDVRERLASVDEPASFPTDNLRPTVRLEIALERLARGYSGVALRCWPEVPDQAGTMACAAFARLADRGVPLACEGDAGGLISMLVTAAVSGHPAALLDLSHLEESALLFWHCGNAPRTWASGQPRLALHFNRGLPAVRDMRLAPGPASTRARCSPAKRATTGSRDGSATCAGAGNPYRPAGSCPASSITACRITSRGRAGTPKPP